MRSASKNNACEIENDSTYLSRRSTMSYHHHHQHPRSQSIYVKDENVASEYQPPRSSSTYRKRNDVDIPEVLQLQVMNLTNYQTFSPLTSNNEVGSADYLNRRRRLKDATNETESQRRSALKSRYPQYGVLDRDIIRDQYDDEVQLKQQPRRAHLSDSILGLQEIQNSNAYLKAMKALQDKLKVLEKERDEQRAELNEKDELISGLQAKLVESSQSLAEATKKMNNDEQEYVMKEQSIVSKLNAAELLVESLTVKNKAQTLQKQEISQLYEKEQQTNATLLKKHRQEISEKNSQVDSLNALVADQAQQIESLVSDNTLMNSDIEVIRAKYLELQKRAQCSESTVEEQAKTIKSIEAHNSQLLGDLRAVSEENKQVTCVSEAAQNLNSKLLSSNFRMSTRHSDSPVLGISKRLSASNLSEATFAMPPRVFTSLTSRDLSQMAHAVSSQKRSDRKPNKVTAAARGMTSRDEEAMNSDPLSMSQISVNTDHNNYERSRVDHNLSFRQHVAAKFDMRDHSTTSQQQTLQKETYEYEDSIGFPKKQQQSIRHNPHHFLSSSSSKFHTHQNHLESLDESFAAAAAVTSSNEHHHHSHLHNSSQHNQRRNRSTYNHHNRSRSSLSFAKMSTNTFADENEGYPSLNDSTIAIRSKHEFKTVIQAVIDVEKQLVELRHVYDSLARDVYNFTGDEIYLTVLNKKMQDMSEKIKQKKSLLAQLKRQEHELASSVLSTIA